MHRCHGQVSSNTSYASHAYRKKKNRFEKLRKQQRSSSHQVRKRGHLGRKALHQKRRKQSIRIRRAAGRQASRPLLISLKVSRMLKRTSGLYKLMSVVHRMSMKLESKFLDSVNQGRDFSEEPKCEECKKHPVHLRE